MRIKYSRGMKSSLRKGLADFPKRHVLLPVEVGEGIANFFPFFSRMDVLRKGLAGGCWIVLHFPNWTMGCLY